MKRYLTLTIIFCLYAKLFATDSVPTKRILFINTHGRDIPAIRLFTDGYIKKMQEKNIEAQYLYEYMDLYKYSGNETKYFESIKDLLKIKYQNSSPDIIVGLTHGANTLLGKYREDLFPNVPVLSAEVEDLKLRNNHEHFYEVLDTFSVHKLFSIIPLLHPNVEKIYAVIGNSEREKRGTVFLKRGIKEIEKNIEVVFTNHYTTKELIELANKKDQNAVLLYLYVFEDGEGVKHIPATVLKAINENAQMPIYNMMSHTMYGNVIGGYAESFEMLGEAAASKSIEILFNDKHNIKKLEKISTFRYVFNKQAIDKFNIDIKKLPKDSLIIHQADSFWKLYWKYILVGLCLLIIQSLLIIILLRNIATRKRVETELSTVNKTLEEKVESQVADIKERNKELLETNNEITTLQIFKEKMMNMVIHDIKSPLSSIVNSKFLTDNDKRISLMEQAGFKILHLVENILAVKKYESAVMQLNLVSFDVRKTISLVVDEFNVKLKQKSITVNVVLVEHFWVVADKDILQRIITNLLSNAIKFSPHGGIITIQVSSQNKDKLKVEISNQGPIIKKEKQALIFQEYNQDEQRNDGKIGSTGLGLSFCKIAIESHGEEIGVISEPDEDVIFWFTLSESTSSAEKQSKVLLDKTTITLTETDKMYLYTFKNDLEKLQTYEVSAILQLINEINSDNENIIKWCEQLRFAVSNCDDDSYKRLLQFD